MTEVLDCPIPIRQPRSARHPNRDRIGDLRRQSLRQQAERANWELGALLRRLHHEMPSAVADVVAAADALREIAERCSPAKPGAPRQGELF